MRDKGPLYLEFQFLDFLPRFGWFPTTVDRRLVNTEGAWVQKGFLTPIFRIYFWADTSEIYGSKTRFRCRGTTYQKMAAVHFSIIALKEKDSGLGKIHCLAASGPVTQIGPLAQQLPSVPVGQWSKVPNGRREGAGSIPAHPLLNLNFVWRHFSGLLTLPASNSSITAVPPLVECLGS